MTDLQRLKSLFAELVEVPPDQRLEQLDRCDIDENTRRHLRALLDADAALAASTARRALPASALDGARWIGRRVGAFAIERELGRGGMGSVFLARRADGSVEQDVAVKLIRPEQLDEHTLARFRLERQVLALLKHPGIATLLDLGELDDGTPYVVMELVDGVPITQYVRERKLDLHQRLRLFSDVCNAVSHAHRSMIVHRDLKPSNILVMPNGQPKLLDFGIAKPLLGRLGTQEIHETNDAQRFFSPYNAAPEQLRGGPITVGCDVYGLGVLLYELLTDNEPFDFAGKMAGQIEQLILQTEPPAPSLRNGTNPARTLRGDLDAIALKALRKDPQQRYASVDELLADIQNYLCGRPVVARKGRRWYRVRKFVGRNRIALVVAAIFVVLAGVAAAVLWSQALEVIRQRDRAQQATAFLIETFRAADPQQALGEKLTAKQILDQAQRSLKLESGMSPRLRAELLGRIAEVKIHLSAAQDALPLLAEALSDLDRDPSADPDTRARLLELQARASITVGQYDQAKTAIANAAALNSSIALRALIEQDTIELLYMQGAKDELRPPIEKALHELAPQFAADDPARWELLTNVAPKMQVTAGVKQAIALLEDLLHGQSGAVQEQPYVLRAKATLAGLYENAHRISDAKALYESLRQPIERLYGNDSEEFASWENQMANVLVDDNQPAQALPLYEHALSVHEKRLGPESSYVVTSKFNIAGAAEAAEQWELADNTYRESIELAAKFMPDTNEDVEMFRTAYALFLNKRHRFAEAGPLFKVAMSRVDRNPQFSDDDVYKAARMGLAIAEYASAPTQEHRQAFERVSTPPADASQEIKGITREQMDVMKFLGLPLPELEESAGSHSKAQ